MGTGVSVGVIACSVVSAEVGVGIGVAVGTAVAVLDGAAVAVDQSAVAGQAGGDAGPTDQGMGGFEVDGEPSIYSTVQYPPLSQRPEAGLKPTVGEPEVFA